MLCTQSLAVMLRCVPRFLPSACFSSHVCKTERVPEGGKATRTCTT